MVTTRRLASSLADPKHEPRKFRKTKNSAKSPKIPDPPAKDSAAAIANDLAAQSSREPPCLPESLSDGHEHVNASKSDNANEILDSDVDVDVENINAKTHAIEDPAKNVSGQNTTDKWSAINVAEIIPPGSTERSLRPGALGDVLCSSEKQDLTPCDGPHLSKAQRPAKHQKTISTEDGRSVMHAKSFKYVEETDSPSASLSLSSKRSPVPKKSKSLLKRKRPATEHVTDSGGILNENQYKRCKKTAFQAQIDKENLWMNRSISYMLDALKFNDALSKQYEENAATSKKRRNELDGGLENQRKTIKDQGDVLERGINHIVLCGARELNFTRHWGGI